MLQRQLLQFSHGSGSPGQTATSGLVGSGSEFPTQRHWRPWESAFVTFLENVGGASLKMLP